MGNIACLTFESGWAVALVAVDQVGTASAVGAWSRQTLVELVVAVTAGKPRPAVALVGADLVPTDAVIAQALVLSTLVHVLGARLALPAVRTGAIEATPGPGRADASVETGCAGAVVYRQRAALVRRRQVDADLIGRTGGPDAVVHVVLAPKTIETCVCAQRRKSLFEVAR